MSSDRDLSMWFELSYAQYLTIPRSVLEAMPREWQDRLAALLFELDERLDWRPGGLDRYYCYLRDGSTGRFKHDPLSNYRYPSFALLAEMQRSRLGNGHASSR